MIRRTLIVAIAVAGLWVAPAQASTWCGTPATADRAPELFGGPQIHGVYAIPSDGTDRLSLLSSVMQTDVESIDAWWRGQDPTRAPRFDLFPFSCGPQLDITTVRLPESGAQLTSPVQDYTSIFVDLARDGLLTPDSDPLVYFDGPVTDANVCGIGGPSANGTSGLAIVFVGACVGTFSDWSAAHEMTHSLGAVAAGAPHRCADSGHTCDITNDLMYPFTDGSPLSTSILDPGHDDYYAHSGGWLDVQDSPYLKHLDAQVHLALTIAGAGKVESTSAGVACSTTCGTDWNAGAKFSLIPTPGNGLRFLRWSGDCTGTTCDLTLDASKSVTATFVPATFRLTASVGGQGKVTSKPSGIACKPKCTFAFTSFRPVKLAAKPAKGWKFKSWTGGCHGKLLSCTVPMTKAASARAVFVKKPKPKKK